MPDAMDRCQQYNIDAVDDAQRRRASASPAAGLAACERLDCGEPINPERTALGARLCMECQGEADARDAHFRALGKR